MERSKRLAIHFIFGVALVDFQVTDQFRTPINWKAFEKVPKILVVAEKKSSESAKEWGLLLADRFNSGQHPSKEHLQKLEEIEKIKVIPVASLPEVPDFFKGIFYTGFQNRNSNMGIILDFGKSLTSAIGLQDLDKSPALVFFKTSSLSDSVDPLIFYGQPSDQKTRETVFEAIETAMRLRKK